MLEFSFIRYAFEYTGAHTMRHGRWTGLTGLPLMLVMVMAGCVRCCVVSTHVRYGFEYTVYGCSYKEGMADLVSKSGVKAVVMGMRKGDPYTGAFVIMPLIS